MGHLLVDASCLIGLLKAGGLDVLHRAPRSVASTNAVLDEVVDASFPETSILEEGKRGWIEIRSPGSVSSSENLGPGETSLFAARREEDLLVLDDGIARNYARSRSWPFTGTIGLLVASAEKTWLDPVESLRLLEVLSQTDFRMNVDVYRHARELIEATVAEQQE